MHMNINTSTFERMSCIASDDPVKRGLELTCEQCHEVICDIEPGDSFEILILTANDHKCEL